MWEVAEYDAAGRRFEFGRGGYQGGQQGVAPAQGDTVFPHCQILSLTAMPFRRDF